jgi:hypothetical protein
MNRVELNGCVPDGCALRGFYRDGARDGKPGRGAARRRGSGRGSEAVRAVAAMHGWTRADRFRLRKRVDVILTKAIVDLQKGMEQRPRWRTGHLPSPLR